LPVHANDHAPRHPGLPRRRRPCFGRHHLTDARALPQVAVNVHGRTVVAWERLTNRRFAVEVRIGGAPLKLGAARLLARQGFKPQVAIGNDGTAAVQWQEENSKFNRRSILVAIARPGHGFGAAHVLDGERKANMAPVAVAVQPNGRVVAVWRRSAEQLAYALASRNHGFGAARTIASTNSLHENALAVDPRDGAVVLVAGIPAAPPAGGQAAVRTLTQSATTFSDPAVLAAGAVQGEPIAMSGPAGAGVAYTVAGLPALNIARRGLDSSWTTTQRIAIPAYPQNTGARELRATLPADGAAIGAWSVVTESTDPFAQPLSSQTVASITTPAAALGAPQALTPAGASFGPPVVVSAGNEAFLATAEKHGRVLLATRATGAGTFQGPTALTTKGDGDVLLAAGGSHVIAAYQQSDRLTLRVVR
jgi:hypothetical protein